ncbi:MAG: ASKHA domain-containing protein, partial [Bacillota bacterium]|nr:ASKHA domain-containing protein [Bacillota bacterium]
MKITLHSEKQGETEFFSEGVARISDALTAMTADILFHCGGNGRCGGCKVRITGGVLPPGDAEKRFLSEQELRSGIRLCCLAEAYGDCDVYIPDKGELSVLTSGVMPEFKLSPLFDGKYGVACDIGTTTVALNLFSLESGAVLARAQAKNEQAAFGADVISRIAAAIEKGVSPLRDKTVGQLNFLLDGLYREAGINKEEVTGAVITGNTTMLHFLTGLNPEGIASAPFKPQSLFGEFYNASGLGLIINGKVYLPRAVSAFIGPDIGCGALACSLHKLSGNNLFIDIGTNGEMLLTSGYETICCSAAAGPAFEGAGISCSMPAFPGAVDKIVFKGEKRFSVSVLGKKEPIGICGSGLVDALAFFKSAGITDESGRIQKTGHAFASLVSEDDARGRFFKLCGEKVVITQQDIRQLQLAKAAISAGIEAMLFESGIKTENLGSVFVSGGFGSFINAENAEKIGLFPDGLADKLTVAGNTALSGASLILLSKENAGNVI